MLFNSYGFIFLYLPIVLAGFFLIAQRNHRMAAFWLAVCSIFFYGWWNPRFVALLLASIAFNYAAGYLIGHARASGRSKIILVGALVANLTLLGVFKYANFFIATANGAGTHIGLLQIVLPLGISFFTFTQIAFLVVGAGANVLKFSRPEIADGFMASGVIRNGNCGGELMGFQIST